MTLNMENDQSRSTPVEAASAPAAADGSALSLPEDAIVIVPVRNMILFPGMILPLNIGRETSIAAAQYAVRAERSIGLPGDRSGIEPDPVEVNGAVVALDDVAGARSHEGHGVALILLEDPPSRNRERHTRSEPGRGVEAG